MKKIYALLVLVLFFISPVVIKAQIGVTVTNPTNTTPNLAATYIDLATALTDLNAVTGMTGPVILTLDAGASEIAPNTGFTIGSASLNAVLSAVNTVTIVKAAGPATVINAGAGGTGTPSSAVQNGILKIVGADYITIDGLNFTDGNLAAPATMEYGIGLFKLSATDGARFNTIQNCVITLNRDNNAAGASPSANGSRGINVVNATATAQTTAVTVTNATGTNSGNKFYTNTIQNSNIGIALVGYAAASPYTNADQSNDVGGLANATGNQILNFGGGAAAVNAAYGVYTLAQYGLNISFNTINNNNGSGVKHVTNISAVFLGTAVNASSTVSNNTITVQAAGGGAVPLYIVENQSGGTGAGNTVNISSNVFSGCSYSTHTSGAVRAIFNSATASNLVIGSNTINPIALNSVSAGTGIISLIHQSAVIGTLSDINSNVFVDQSWNTSGNAYLIFDNNSTQNISISGNAVSGICEKTAAGGTFYGYYNFGSPTFGTAIVTGNNFSKIFLTGATTFYGIYLATLTNQIEKINYNTISNITGGTDPTIALYHNYGAVGSEVIGNNVFTVSGGGTVLGIQAGSSQASLGLSIADNKIRTLSTTGTTATAILHTSGASSLIYRNKIYTITATNAAGISSGIEVAGGTSVTVYNNLIGDLRAPSTALANAIMGLNITGGTTVNAYYNTIHINATSTGNPFGTSAVYASTTPTVNLRNNIFVNKSTPVGTGLSVAYRRSGTSLSSYAAASNNNLFWAGTPGASNLIFNDGTNSDQTLTAYRTRVTPMDGASVTENPTFISIAGASVNFLHINTTIPTQIESGAINISPIEDDYDVDDIRQGNPGYTGLGTAPDIGADENDLILLDLTPPVISGIVFTSASCGSALRTFTATITDASGVNNAAFKPRVYFRKNLSGYQSTQGVLTAGSVTNGTWTFTIDYSLLAPPVAGLGDVIDYFIVAQDVAGTPNMTGIPSAGLVLTNVNTVTTPPTTPFTFTITNALSGTYNVGVAQVYPTLTAAIAAYNTSCLTGPVTFVLTDASYSASETFPIVINANSDASAVNTLTIKPNAGVSPTISGSTNDAIIQFNGADYVTIDGSNNGTTSRNLTITNTSVGTASAVLQLNYTVALDPATHNTIKNSIITGNAPTTTLYGIFSGDYAIDFYGLAANNSNTYQNNSVSNAYLGIGIGGPNSTETGLVIADNSLSNIGFQGIWTRNQTGLSITNNEVQAISSINGSSFDPTSGIIADGTINGGSISRNTIHNIVNTNSGGWASYGITLQAGNSNTGLTVSNNMLYDIYGVGFTSISADNGHGMAITTGGGYNVYYNSVNMSTNQSGGAGTSAAIYIKATVAANSLNIRNNIFVNTQTTGTRYTIYCAATNAVFTNINYNNYWNQTGGNIGFLGSARATLAAWKTASGADLNSVNVNPQFISAVNLHLNVASSTLDGLATPIAGITTDYDLDVRNVATPDIGADEFTLNPCAGAVGGTATGNGNTSLCVSGIPTITASGYSLGTGSGYQWQSSLDNFVTAPFDIVGQVNPANLTVGSIAVTTYYRLKVTCPSGAALAYSNTVTIAVNSPAVSSPVNGSRCGTGTVNISATPSAGASINWYDASTGGLPLFTGNTYTTPVLTTGVTTYYASAAVGGVTEAGGKPSSPGSDGATLFTTTGIVFDAIQNLNLISTVVYPVGTGTVTFAIYDNAGTELAATAAIALTGTGTATPITVPLGFAVPVGTGYRLAVKTFTGFAGLGEGLLRDFSGNVFPYVSPSGALSVTGGLFIGGASGTNYFFYNILISTSCESARTAITATVTAATPITAAASPASICEGFSSTLSVTSALPTYVYTWTPAGPGVVSPLTTTKYYVSALAPGGCTAIDSVTVTVNPKPGTITVSPASPNICGSGSTTMTASGGTYSGVATANSGVISLVVPDFNTAGTSTSLAIAGVPAGATIDSVIVSFSVTHAFDDEMILNLEAPNGQIINLVSGLSVPFGGDDFLNTRITSNNTFPNLSSGTAPFTGTFKADAASSFGLSPSPLPTTTTWAPLYGTPNGSWTLRLHDDSNGDLGTLTNWSVKVAYTALPTWSWGPNLFLNTTTGNVVTSTTPVSQLYTITATNAAGCINTKNVTVNVVTYPVSVSVTSVPAGTICAGTSVTFTADTLNAGATPFYTWQVNGVTIPAASGVGNLYKTYTTSTLAPGDAVRCILQSSIVSCTTNNPDTSNVISLTINPTTATSVSIAASPAGAVCAGTSVTFTATPVNGGAAPTYEWFIGGVSQGAPSALTTFTPAPLSNGQVVTCRMVSNAANCPSPVNPTSPGITMVVNPIVPITVSLVQSPAGSVCIGSTVTYTATPNVLTGGPLYEFFVDGASQGAPSATNFLSIATLAIGGHTIDVEVTYSTNPCASPVPAIGTVNTTVTAAITPAVSLTPKATVCPGSTVLFTATPTTGGALDYEFFVGGISQGAPSVTNTFSHTFTVSEIISVVMTSSSGCATAPTATDSYTQLLYTPPSSTITGSSPLCPGIPILLTSGAAGGSGSVSSIQWRLNYANIVGATNPTHLATAAGLYKVTVTSSDGCVDTSSASFNLAAAPSLMAGPYTIGAVTATAAAGSAGTTINVASTVNLVLGAAVTVTSGTGLFQANTIITGIVPGVSFSVDKVPTTLPTAGAVIAGATCTNYISFVTAINDLNSRAISAPCIFDVPAGYTETLTAATPQLRLGSNVAPDLNSTMAGKSITFQKNGVGANPVINAYIGTATPASASPDGIWSFRGIDNVTVDGIDLKDNNAANPATMEFGYGFFKLSATDGAQNNTIKNCTIDLNKINNATATPPMVEGSVGILVINATNTTATTPITPTLASGTNSNNKFYSNTIRNCNHGIALSGFSAVSPFTLGDSGNDIGGAALATGNTIVNFGGAAGASNPAAGVRANFQWGVNISFNTINNNNGSGTNHPNALRGIYGQAGLSANATINDNTITLNSGLATGTVIGIDNTIGATAASNTISISNNTITGTHPLMTSGTWTGITNAANATTVNINGNKVDNVVLPVTATGTFTGIANTAAALNVTISNNRVQGNTLPGNGAFLGIANTGAITTSLAINNNKVNSNTKSGTGAMTLVAIGSPVAPATIQASTDTITNNTVTSSGAAVTLICLSMGGGANTTATASANIISNNSITGMSGAGIGTLYGYSNAASTVNETVSNNTINDLFVTGTITSTGLHVIYGIRNVTVPASVRNVTGNTIYNLYSNAGSNATISGIQSQTGGTVTISKNKIYNLFPGQNGAVVSTAKGITVTTGTTAVTLSNNMIALDLGRAALATSGVAGSGILTNSDALKGIEITSAAANSNINVYYNSVRLAGTGGVGFGSSGINHAASITSTTAALNLRNNIIDNESTPNGGLVVAYRRSVGTANNLNNYGATSNNNDFYAGTPSANNLIYSDGTSTAQNIVAYKGGVFTAGTIAPRDAASISELPVFINPVIGDLRLGANNCNINGAGAGIAGFTDDYEGDARLAVGITDIGADEIATPVNPVTAFNVNNPAGVCSGGSVDLTAPAITAGSAGGAGFYYYSDAAGLTPLASPNNITVAGTYFIKYYIGNCYFNADTIKPVVVSFNPAGTWLGISTDWTNPANWCLGGLIPTSATNVIIPGSVSNYPVIVAGVSALANNVSIAAGASLTTTGTGSLDIKGTFTNSGTLNNWGEIKLTGASAQTFPGATGTVAAMGKLTIANTSGANPAVTIDRDLLIRDVITPSTGIVNLNNIYITLRSVVDSTARVGVVGGSFTYTGTGNFVVERYYPSRRTWRLLTAPVVVPNIRTIFSSWQAGGNNSVAGNATFMTGPSPNQATNGLDASPLNNFSLKRFNYATSGFDGISNTRNARVSGFPAGNTSSYLTDTMGYFVFIRGDRTAANVNAFNSYGLVTTTTLRDTGNIKTGAFTYNCNPGSGANIYTLVGNPYASPVDFAALTRSNVNNKFWAWDPNLGSVGGYVTLDFASGYTPVKVPNTLTGSVAQTQVIQSSQAILVEATGAAPSITFNEANKSATNVLGVFRPGSNRSVSTVSSNIFYAATAQTGRDILADGVVTQFNGDFSKSVDVLDAVKFSNVNETFSIVSNNSTLSLERRPLLTENDTLFYSLNRSTQRSYKFNVLVQNFDQANITGFLEDSYLRSSTPVNMNGETWVDFSVNSDVASAAKNRFRIVFKKLIQYTNINGYVQNSDVVVDWAVANEQNIHHYEIERSVDGMSFESLGNQLCNGNSTAKNYSWLDLNPASGVYFYRIKCVGNSGAIAYSEVAKVTVNRKGNGMYIFPNPVTINKIGLQLNTMPAGTYTARLLNGTGQVVSSNIIVHAGGTSTQTIIPEHALISGSYQMEVTGPDKKKTVLKVIVQTK